MIIIAVTEQNVLYGASERSFERYVLVEQVFQSREVVRGLPWIDSDIGEIKKTCIN